MHTLRHDPFNTAQDATCQVDRSGSQFNLSTSVYINLFLSYNFDDIKELFLSLLSPSVSLFICFIREYAKNIHRGDGCDLMKGAIHF